MANQYRYSFDLGSLFDTEEEATPVEPTGGLVPKPNAKAPEAAPEVKPMGFVKTFADALQVTYDGAIDRYQQKSNVGPKDKAFEEFLGGAGSIEELLAPPAGSLPFPEGFSIVPSPAPVTVEAKGKAPYSVVSGDNLSKIAKKNDTTVEALLKANPDIDNPNLISVGQEIKLPAAAPVEEAAPAKTGTGLMSKPAATPEATTASTLTDLIYTDFVDAGQEGDEAHVGQDNKNITLPGGVVPDGLVYDGKAHTQDKSVIANFDKSKLDTSGAYKKVGSKTIRRSDYDSDNAFAKGVIGAFKDEAKEAAGDSWDSMSEGSKKAVVKIGWNKGTGWYSGKSAKAIYKELAKETPEPSNLYSKILVGSTVKGGGASLGIAKARANAWNETISATGGKEITKIVADNSGKNTALKYYDAQGNLLHTEQTNRAVSLYENTATTISKDSKGVW